MWPALYLLYLPTTSSWGLIQCQLSTVDNVLHKRGNCMRQRDACNAGNEPGKQYSLQPSVISKVCLRQTCRNRSGCRNGNAPVPCSIAGHTTGQDAVDSGSRKGKHLGSHVRQNAQRPLLACLLLKHQHQVAVERQQVTVSEHPE